jgi:hypothetical protein
MLRDATQGDGLLRLILPDLREYRTQGRHHVARSPLAGPDGDRTPSFFVEVNGRYWKCFSTSQQGDWYRYLLAQFPHLTTRERLNIAIERLRAPFDLRAAGHVDTTAAPERPRSEFYSVAEVRELTRSRGVFEKYVLSMAPDRMEPRLSDYMLGTDAQGRTLFWHIDVHGNIHGAKATTYRLNSDGKPTKKPASGPPRITWLWKEGQTMADCSWKPAYGEHLLRNARPEIVYILEAEDNVFTMQTTRFGQDAGALWLASGGIPGAAFFARIRACLQYMHPDASPEWWFMHDRDVTNEQLDNVEAIAQRVAGINIQRGRVDEVARMWGYHGKLGPKWDIGDLIHERHYKGCTS